jgi:hypothetical protein
MIIPLDGRILVEIKDSIITIKDIRVTLEELIVYLRLVDSLLVTNLDTLRNSISKAIANRKDKMGSWNVVDIYHLYKLYRLVKQLKKSSKTYETLASDIVKLKLYKRDDFKNKEALCFMGLRRQMKKVIDKNSTFSYYASRHITYELSYYFRIFYKV